MPTKVMEEEQRLHALKAVNGDILTVGDRVIHEGSKEERIAEVIGFYWDKRLGEYRAKTTKGHAGLDYLTKIT